MKIAYYVKSKRQKKAIKIRLCQPVQDYKDKGIMS